MRIAQLFILAKLAKKTDPILKAHAFSSEQKHGV
jgi:hypothetical protein